MNTDEARPQIFALMGTVISGYGQLRIRNGTHIRTKHRGNPPHWEGMSQTILFSPVIFPQARPLLRLARSTSARSAHSVCKLHDFSHLGNFNFLRAFNPGPRHICRVMSSTVHRDRWARGLHLRPGDARCLALAYSLHACAVCRCVNFGGFRLVGCAI